MATSYLLVLPCAYLLTRLTEGSKCPNQYYCHTDEVKYRSFTEMTQTFLNSTKVISSMPIKETAQCIGKCIKIENCQSINHYFENKQSQMLCDLIDANRWSNASLIHKRKKSTHYYINSPCSSNPCKNGGTCTPLYQNGTYKCDCTANNYTVWKTGKHCEVLSVAEETADVYYAFNENSTLKDLRGSKSLTVHGNAKVIWVPDRTSPVVYLPGAAGSYLKSTPYGAGYLTMEKIGSAPIGLSVSFWFKILKRSQDKFEGTSCRTKYLVPIQSTDPSGSAGFRVEIFGCNTQAFQILVQTEKFRHKLNWGSAQNLDLHRSWSHLMFTAKRITRDIDIILYFNGQEMTRQKTKEKTPPAASSKCPLTFGNSTIEAYLDDVAAWYMQFSASDVQTVYNEGLKRNLRKSTVL